MVDKTTTIVGIVIPSASPLFLAFVGLHVIVALACVVAGFVAMLSNKRPGRHPKFGSIYYWCLSAVFASATVLSAMRWAEDYHLFILGALSFASATLGRMARRHLWRNWVRLHITGMGSSYVVLLIAFYVDNGKNLPLWKDLPPISYWLIPTMIGAPLVVRALFRHPLVKHPNG
jgi:uncharacterized membrane protein